MSAMGTGLRRCDDKGGFLGLDPLATGKNPSYFPASIDRKIQGTAREQPTMTIIPTRVLQKAGPGSFW
jgi:hypothetical protein